MNSQIPTYKEMVETMKRSKAFQFDMEMVDQGRFVVCSCGRDYGDYSVPESEWEIINSCPNCKE